MAGPSECGIQVFCRFRPMNSKEERENNKFVPKFPAGTEDQISVAGKVYMFDKVFKPNSTQEQVYKGSAYHIVQDVLSGYNGTIFAYGQTSSGKTHTMEGVFGSELQGIIPRIVQDIFNHIYTMDVKLEFQIKVSYYEIYNERIRDLLDITKVNLAIHEDKNRVPYVKGATEQAVASPEDIMSCIDQGKANRMVAVTNMNEHSSRSHSVFLIAIQQRDTETNKQLSGKLYLVDLAGSEKVSKTGAEGSTLEEAKNINKSLTSLGMVIAALAEGNKSHIPYRDSKLTRILQESLGGNSRTTVIICCSPAETNEAETKSTLQFGARAKTIKNVVAINEELSADEWRRRYEKEREKVARLKAQLAAAQMELDRWRSGGKVPESEWVRFDDATLAALPGMTMSSAPSDSMLSMERSMIAPPPLTSTNGPITDEEKRRYEEERAKLYQQLDDKDDEIQNLSSKTEQIKQQMVDLEDQVNILREEREASSIENQAMLQANEAAKEETKEVLNALEELALNFDTKAQEAEAKERENDLLNEDLQKKTLDLHEAKAEVDTLRETVGAHKRKLNDYVNNMLKELQEVDGAIKVAPGEEDEMLAHMRIQITKLATDFRTAKQKYANLESGSEGVDQKLKALEGELDEVKRNMAQSEAKNKSQQETIEKQVKEKGELEQQIDTLTVRVSSAGASEDGNLSEEQTKLVTQLRNEISEKNKRVDALTLSIKELEAVQVQLTSELEKLRSDEADKEKKIRELAAISDKREQASLDMRGLQETVEKELSALHNLRRQFVTDLAARIKRSTGPDSVEDEFGGSPAQKQKIQFLESNLDKLTKVHKQLVKDNADLRLELPKLEKKLRTTTERVKNLEQALREAKENALRDRKKYQAEVERIKEAVRQRNLARRGMQPQIVKTIRPGQLYAPMGSSPMGTPSPVIRPQGAE
ncbi:unnamed protein product, partial [Mesorhabditis belari]|uniref:Kinesin-like protein n=1 Tax=Mesorhabditis belari TaxID=2138241 RepID=A0AAF3E9C5_9BILA